MLNFLHLTDLHFGLRGQKTLWPNTGDAFYDDLRRLREKVGPWQVVLFSGDLVQQGDEDEFDALDNEILDPMWNEFNKLGCDPVLLTVPGNHDLVRPSNKDAAAADLLNPDKFPAIAEHVFDDERESPYRDVIDTAFANYRKWWTRRIGSTGLQFGESLMPGDFAVSLAIDSHLVGVVGLNTTFLQLAGGDYRGKLVVTQRQLHRACGGDGAAWARRHDACILMTHQGPGWLTAESRSELEREICPADRFVVHLFGHEHQLELESRARAGSKASQLWQGSSLFGLEQIGDPPALERRHGFSAGRLDFRQDKGSLCLWPRKGVGNPRWRFIPDHESAELDESGATTWPVSWPMAAPGRDVRRRTDGAMWTLGRAQEDLANQLRQLDRKDVVELRHIGLDMVQAHARLVEIVRDVLSERYAVTEAALKLLTIGSDPQLFTGFVPASVERMIQNAATSVGNVVDGLKGLDNGQASKKKKLTIDLRTYHQVPTLHGFSLVRSGRSESPIATYLSLCRWKPDGSDLDWGAMSYRRVLGSGGDHSSKDLLAIFDGAFAYLWRTSKPREAFLIGRKAG